MATQRNSERRETPLSLEQRTRVAHILAGDIFETRCGNCYCNCSNEDLLACARLMRAQAIVDANENPLCDRLDQIHVLATDATRPLILRVAQIKELAAGFAKIVA